MVFHGGSTVPPLDVKWHSGTCVADRVSEGGEIPWNSLYKTGVDTYPCDVL